MSQSAKRVVLVSRPVGEPKGSDFRVEDYALPTPGEGQVLLRTIWLSLDPYMRAILCGAGADRRGNGGRHGVRGDRLE
jgi:NADPH-dependent curcumin reductase CurA